MVSKSRFDKFEDLTCRGILPKRLRRREIGGAVGTETLTVVVIVIPTPADRFAVVINQDILLPTLIAVEVLQSQSGSSVCELLKGFRVAIEVPIRKDAEFQVEFGGRVLDHVLHAEVAWLRHEQSLGLELTHVVAEDVGKA